MKKTILKYTWFVIAISLWSCYEDKGNYDYTDKEQIKISGMFTDTSVVAYASTIKIGDRLKIESSETGELEYLWTLFSNERGTTTMDTIGRDRNLSYDVNNKQGNYILSLKVTNKNTGYFVYQTSTVYVTTQFSLGWYILKEIDGNSELDMFNMEDKYSENLLQKINGSSQKGKPSYVSIAPKYNYMKDGGKFRSRKVIVVCSDNDIRILSTDNLSVIWDYSSIFYTPSDRVEKSIRMTTPGSSYYYYMTDRGVYYTGLVAPPGNGKFGATLKLDTPMSLSKYACSDEFHDNTTFYDNEGERFLALDYNGALSEIPDKDKNDKPMTYPANKTGCQMLYMGRCQTSETNYYAIMKNKTSGKIYSYSLTADAFKETYYNPIEVVVEIPASSKLYDATVFGHHDAVPYTYFSNDNNLNIYDNITNNEELGVVKFPDQEKIAFIKNMYHNTPGDTNIFNYIIIGTNNAGKYKIYFYNHLAGKPYGDPVKILSGNGNIADIQFFTSRMSINSKYIY